MNTKHARKFVGSGKGHGVRPKDIRVIERKYHYKLYYSEGRYYVEYYGDTLIHSYTTEAAAREAIYYHDN